MVTFMRPTIGEVACFLRHLLIICITSHEDNVHIVCMQASVCVCVCVSERVCVCVSERVCVCVCVEQTLGQREQSLSESREICQSNQHAAP